VARDHGTARGKRRRFALIAAAAAFISALASAAWSLRETPAERADRKLAEARSLRAAGDLLAAERSAVSALDADPARGDAALLAAECAAARRDFRAAVNYAARATTGPPRVRLRAALLAARTCHYRLYRLWDAEAAYRRALQVAPQDVVANTGLATLLGLCGRRAEAVPHALRVIRKGEPTDLVVMLARQSGAVEDPDLLGKARHADSVDPSPLLGLAWQAASAGRPDEAVDLLRDAIRLRPDLAAAHVALGGQLLAANRFDDLVRWSKELPAPAAEFADAWVVRGRIAEYGGDLDGAIRCYLEASRRAPEAKDPNVRLARLLARSGDGRAAAPFVSRAQALQELEEALDLILFSQGQKSVESLLDLCRRFESCGRLWEAYGWSLFAVNAAPDREDVLRRVAELRRNVDGLPLRLTADASNVALGVDVSRYPLPSFEPGASGSRVDRFVASASPSFRDDADAAGLTFRYFNGTAGPPSHRMFEFTGGGVGIIDLELDGFADIFFTQGRPWPPASGDGRRGGDRLFRNTGVRFRDVSDSAGVREDDFGQGVSVGDIDADGFPDLYVGNIGPNRLWLNNGDGTLADATEAMGLGGGEWTTSCVAADLDGDGLTDLYDVNYVAGHDVFDRVCRHADGTPALCMPYDFGGQPDRLWINADAGRFTDATETALPGGQEGKGLGALAWAPFGDGRLSLFVANDTTPNFFLVPEVDKADVFRLIDRGIESGLAFNAEGKATGSMGVAFGDVDGDGNPDLYVTNFLAEGSSLYTSPVAGAFADEAGDAGLAASTFNQLGFGTQCIDADLDGGLEIFASNGHVDDLRRQGKPYEMKPQLFRRAGSVFEEVPAADLGPYFERKWLGRAVARFDWDRDGREDLVVGHLDANAAMLTNTTEGAGNSLSLRLAGIQSNRDAIGTDVRIRIGDRASVRQLTSGDGYQASNERRLVFGVGKADRIDEMTVRWPSGLVQHFADIPASCRLFLKEGGELLSE